MGSKNRLLPLTTIGLSLMTVHAANAQEAPAAATTPPTAPVAPATPQTAPVTAAAPTAAAPTAATPPAQAPVTAATATAVEAAPPVAPPTPAPEPATPKETPAPTIKDRLKIGGGGILWYYQPTVDGQKNNLEFFNTRLTFDADFGEGFAFHFEPRIRDTKQRSFIAGTAWIQEGYGSYKFGSHTFKLGKIYSQLGLFWDNSFWGNVQVYDGLKLAPDYGGSLEGKFELAPSFALGYAAQFFLVDGSTNVSLPGRDTISIPDSRRRNQVLLRVDPTLKWDGGDARLGISGAHLNADSPGIPDDSVLRYAVDFKVTHAGFGAWGEYLHQNGQSVTDYPIAGIPATDTTPAVPGRASDDIDYFEIGAEYTYHRFTARYNFSAATYKGVDVKEWLHVPALGFKINDNLQLGAEYVHWSRSLSGTHERYNRSFNLLLYVSF
ncbi:MAG: hypothetical protein QM756_35675 [Polyangiaceae bacterium]